MCPGCIGSTLLLLGGAASAGTGDMIAPTFSAPVTQLAVVLVVGAVAGVLAGLRPARRAAKLPVLQAVAAE